MLKKKKITTSLLLACSWLVSCSTLGKSGYASVNDSLTTSDNQEDNKDTSIESLDHIEDKNIDTQIKNKAQPFNVINSFSKENEKPEFSYKYNDY